SGAKIGIGSGRLFGNGFQNGEMSQSGRVPEVHTDFIFTVIGEEFGFLGTAILLIIYFVMIYRMIIIAINSKDSFGMMLVAGVVGLLSFQIFQNIGMTIGLVPIDRKSTRLNSSHVSISYAVFISLSSILSLHDALPILIGEEFGFLGTAILLIIYFVMIYRMIIIAINSKDSFGMMLVAGVVGLLSFQIFQNIGMTIGLVP